LVEALHHPILDLGVFNQEVLVTQED